MIVSLPSLGKLRPIGAHAFLVVEPAAGMRERQRHRCQALGGRVHHDHGVLFPGLAGCLVPNPAPKVDHLLPVAIEAARSRLFLLR